MITSRSPAECHNAFKHDMEDHGVYLDAMMNPNLRLSKEQLAYLVEGAVGRLTACGEGHLENLMVTSVYHHRQHANGILGTHTPTIEDLEACRDDIIEETGSLICSNTMALVATSEKLLPDETNPFLELKNHHKPIRRVYKFRNYLAHYSFDSWVALKNLYEGRYHREWIRPGYFLLEENAKHLKKDIIAILSKAFLDMEGSVRTISSGH